METIKVLKISTTDSWDYATATLEQSDINLKELTEDIVKSVGFNKDYEKVIKSDGEDIEYIFQVIEFNEHSLEALKFAKNEEDYDDSKHDSWLIVLDVK